jgi:hypothetical protein
MQVLYLPIIAALCLIYYLHHSSQEPEQHTKEPTHEYAQEAPPSKEDELTPQQRADELYIKKYIRDF